MRNKTIKKVKTEEIQSFSKEHWSIQIIVFQSLGVMSLVCPRHVAARVRLEKA